MTAVAVIAKECLPGRVKTRLQPEFDAVQAATIASAALAATIELLSLLPATRRILAFDGELAPPGTAGWDVLPQRGDGLDERIAHLFDAVDEPLLLLGMDTPHLDPAWLSGLFEPWGDLDAWFGPATDGGFWALGMREPDGSLVRGVAMSTAQTGREQFERLTGAGMTVRLLPPLTDIDTAQDARAAAETCPQLALVLRSIDQERAAA